MQTLDSREDRLREVNNAVNNRSKDPLALRNQRGSTLHGSKGTKISRAMRLIKGLPYSETSCDTSGPKSLVKAVEGGGEMEVRKSRAEMWRKALSAYTSAYTWCESDKGPHNGWLFRNEKGKADSSKCRNGGEHPRVGARSRTRAVANTGRRRGGERGTIGSRRGVERRSEEDEIFFYHVYDFLTSVNPTVNVTPVSLCYYFCTDSPAIVND